MSRASWRIKPTEIARTVKSVQSTGLSIRNIEIDLDGVIRVNVGASDDAGGAPPDTETSAELRKLL